MHHQHSPHNYPANAQLPTQRRRKKRPNYGVRSVEVRRAYRSGFGFTISGQQPCRLSCIIPNSPADQAGLRAGDFLISVNGLNVSKFPHENVVQLIGNSFGSIGLQISEHYYSDSTDEENVAAGIPTLPSKGPPRPRYIYHRTKQRLPAMPQKKSHSSILSLPRPSIQAKKYLNPMQKPLSVETLVSSLLEEKKKSSGADQPFVAAVFNAMPLVKVLPSVALEYRAVVGYLGTIEMPKQIANSSKLQTVRSCIRKMRQEKRQPSMVLMVILPDCMKLQAQNGNILATYTSSRLNYVSSSSESENRFFGLVTSTVYTPQCEEEFDEEDIFRSAASPAFIHTDKNEIVSNSCHVFVVDTKLCEHQHHLTKAEEFRIECTKDPISSLCLEFPNNSEYVVNLIRSMYTMRTVPPITQRSISDDPALHGGKKNGTPHSPQPSNHSEVSTTTSNSDSGIGYNNDCSNIIDRIVLVDFPTSLSVEGSRSWNIQVGNRPQNIAQQNIRLEDDLPSTSERLTVSTALDSKVYNINSTVRSLMTSKSCDDVLNLIEKEADDYIYPDLVGGQQCYASMNDISLQTASMDNCKLQTATVKLEDPVVVSNSRELNIDTWNSLQDVSSHSPKLIDICSSKLSSTPDLTRPELVGSSSPFERSWIQTSLRTPRADKHTINFSTSQDDQIKLYKCLDISRSSSMRSRERNSLKNKHTPKNRCKPLKKAPSSWSTSIETLLSDPAGLKTFAEFLKLEYAAENIYFWTACERFQNLVTLAERQTEALHIYTKHLSNGSLEPVNVDSQARSLVEKNLTNAHRDLFHPAQKQIFNLMKFDSYQRFIRSDLYKQCLHAEKKGKSLPFTAENLDDLLKTTNFLENASSKSKKSGNTADESRPRRSLLPWHRKSRSKSRDKAPLDVKNHPSSTTFSEEGSYGVSLKLNTIHGSASSLASILFDATTFGNSIKPIDLSCSLCRLKFPDGTTTMVELKTQETVGELVDRLMEKRSIRYQFYDVSVRGPPFKFVDLKSSSIELSGKEVDIEQRVTFKLDLPTPKVISVKSKPRKQLCEVVGPILQRYHINPEVVDVLMRENKDKVDLTQLVTSVDNKRLQVVYKKKFPVEMPHRIASLGEGLQTTQTTLDEITNKVYIELMNFKQSREENQCIKHTKQKLDDRISMNSDECPSDTSSFFKIKLGKRDSYKTPAIRTCKSKKTSGILDIKAPENATLISVVKTQLPLKVADKQDNLLEDLKRAQLARLEDQRGTEINSELPEFLRNTNVMSTSDLDSTESLLSPLVTVRPPQPAPRHSITNKSKSASTSPMKIDDDNNLRSLTENNGESSRPSKGPPPLPPKPKVLPMKPSNWGVNMTQVDKVLHLAIFHEPSTTTIASTQVTNANLVATKNSGTGPRCAYLDQPSSSFV